MLLVEFVRRPRRLLALPVFSRKTRRMDSTLSAGFLKFAFDVIFKVLTRPCEESRDEAFNEELNRSRASPVGQVGEHY